MLREQTDSQGDTISRSFTYNSSGGTLASATDFANNTTSFSYGDCNGSFPTQIVQPLSLTSSMAWNCSTGLVSSVTDPNSQATSFDYDELYRLTETNDPDGGQVSTEYNDGPSGSVVTTTKLSTSASREDTAYLDGLGRVTETELNSDPAGTDLTTTSYDDLGRVSNVSNPYRSGSSTGSDTYGYDALSRVTGVTHADSNASHTYYGSNVTSEGGLGSQLCSSSTYGLGYPSLYADEKGKLRETWTDALGRVIEVDEPDAATGSLTDGSELATCYSYDALGDLTQVVQGIQTRTYSYDMLGRLTSATTPESGTTTYSYSGCSGDPSNVCSRTDARNITTTYAYDALNRLTSKSYSDGTPTADFSYDQSSATIGSWSSGTLANTKGRLTEATTGSTQTGLVYSYDPMGRVKSFWQCTPYNCGSSAWQTTYAYDDGGDVASWTHPAGFTITNTINDAQEITQIESSLVGSTYPQYLAQNITYTPWGAEQTLENGCAGSGCTDTLETYAYNNRLQPVMIELGNTSNPSADYCLVYNYYYSAVGTPTSCSMPSQATSYDDGDVNGYYYKDNVNSSLSHSTLYTYDPLNRLSTAVATGNSTYNLAFSYTADGSSGGGRFGNMTCTVNGSTNGLCPQYSFSNANNRITNSGYAYDASGDLTDDGTYAYQYDAEGRLTSVAGGGSTETIAYDASGERSEEITTPGNDVEIVHDPSGRDLAYCDAGGGFCWQEFYNDGRRQFGYYNGSGDWARFLHANALGSTTMTSGYGGGVQADLVMYPWGSLWSSAGDAELDEHFAGFTQIDGAALLYPTPARRYDPPPGRWLTPDPLGGDLTNPQSLNRYAYALNNPTTLIDPLGLQPPGDFDGGDCSDPAYADTHVECQGPGSGYCSASDFTLPGCVGAIGNVGGVIGSGGGGGGAGGGTTHSAPPPPWTSGIGDTASTFQSAGAPPIIGPGIINTPWIFRVITWAWPLLPDIGDAAGRVVPWVGIGASVLMMKSDTTPQAAAYNAASNNGRRFSKNPICDQQYKADIARCKRLPLNQRPACYAQAMERLVSCEQGKPLPPLPF